MTNVTEHLSFTVPLTTEAYRLAEKYSHRHSKQTQKYQQVRLNVLAVYAVIFYCQSMGLEANLTTSDSFDLSSQVFMHVASLELENLGKLNCIPILKDEQDSFCHIPLENRQNYIGHLLVEIDEEQRTAKLIKFAPPLDPLEIEEKFAIDQLKPLEQFLEHIGRLELAIDFCKSNDSVADQVREKFKNQPLSAIATQLERIYRTYDQDELRYAGGDFLANCYSTEELITEKSYYAINRKIELNTQERIAFQDLAEKLLNKLEKAWNDEGLNDSVKTKVVSDVKEDTSTIKISKFFEDINYLSDVGWQTIEDFISSNNLQFGTALRYRKTGTKNPIVSCKRATKISLATEPEISVALIANFVQDYNSIQDILFQVYPLEQGDYLPPNLQLIILDKEDNIFLEAQARESDNWIQLQFRGEPKERFQIKVKLGDSEDIKAFII